MSRSALLALSILDCGFGAVALLSDGDLSTVAYLANFLLALVLMVLTWQDLQRRGWTWQAAAGVTYVIAPLVGLILYFALSSRPLLEEAQPPVARS